MLSGLDQEAPGVGTEKSDDGGTGGLAPVSHDLGSSLDQLKLFNARRELRAAIKSVSRSSPSSFLYKKVGLSLSIRGLPCLACLRRTVFASNAALVTQSSADHP